MKVVILCEGATEQALRQGLREFVHRRTSGSARIGVTTRSLDGPVLRKKLARLVALESARADVVGVVVLTDVYPESKDAQEAKEKLRAFASDAGRAPKFRAHAAQFEVEAWIMPFWEDVARSLSVSASPPGAKPEQINGQKPPSEHLNELYARAKRRYQKAIDGPKWLTADRLERAAPECPELKSFLNSMLELAGAAPFS